MAGKVILKSTVDGEPYYILLKDKTGEKPESEKWRSSTSSTTMKKYISLHKGEILVKVPEKDQPLDKTLIKLSPFETQKVVVECPTTDVQEITKEEALLLLPLCSMGERLRVFQERDKLKSGKKMVIGSTVWVLMTVNSVAREFKGVVKYKGPLPGLIGTMFGVELVTSKGKGSTDGLFRDTFYFHCDKDCGVFVSLDKLSPDKSNKKSGSKSGYFTDKLNGLKDGVATYIEKAVNYMTEKDGHKLNDKVWVYIKDKQERGVITFIGQIPGGTDDILAGIMMDNPCGKGNGKYFENTIFTCQENHAHFTPIDNVISLDMFNEMNGYHEDNDKNAGSLSTVVLRRKSPPIVEGIKHKKEDIVWVYIEDNPQRGIIKYIGRLPGGKDIVAGILMDNACGEGYGECEDKQLFMCDKNHAHFTHIENVIPREKFYQIHTGQTGYEKPNLQEDSSHTQGSSLEDIVNMESKFAKQSEEDVILEQTNILRKLKEAQAVNNTSVKNKDEKSTEGNLSNAKHRTLLNESQEANNSSHSKNDEFKMSQITSCENKNTSASTSHERRYRHSNNTDVSKCGSNNLLPDKSRIKNSQKLDIGSMVEVLSKSSEPRYGVIRWIGFLPNANNKIAGLELEAEMEACTDGLFLGKRYFTCPNKRGFFVHLRNCRPDSRFNKRGNSELLERRLSGVDFGSFVSPIIQDCFVPPPEYHDIYTKPDVPRGIQGHHNSCYLDATLFASFAFSSVIDTVLLRDKEDKDIEQYEQVQSVLRDCIVYPLRANGFVRADRVLELRQLLDRLGNVTGLVGEEKDPEEFLLTLFQQVLKSEPFLKIKSGRDVSNEYFYQVFADKDVERVLPSVEELLKRSFHQSNLKLAEVPSCLIVQMPRFGKGFKMYERILPSLTINIGELVDNAPQDCAVCGYLAKYHCKDCFTLTGFSENDSSGNFCKDCNGRYHSHARRSKHETRPLVVSKEICKHYAQKPVEHQNMELFAVVCIETSHYVSFVRCRDTWCFFDSMSDRVGSKNGYNIPAVTECPEVVQWLSSEKQNRERIINSHDKELPDKIRRILGDAYMCFYQSKEMSMYR